MRFNALKQGLRAKTRVLAGEDEQAYHTRLDAWNEALQPRDEVEQFMVARTVHASWNLERVQRALEARRDAARYADPDRLAALAERVAAMGRRLLWNPNGPLALYPLNDPAHGDFDRPSWSGDPNDPDDPARLVIQIEGTALGCAWLLDRFDKLGGILEDGLLWQPHDRFKAIRLLGRQPLDAIDHKRVMAIYLCCWTMELGIPHGFTDLIPELTAEERTVYFERLNARAPLGAKPETPEAARAALLALIAREEERLEAVLRDHLEREEAEAAAAQAFDDSAYGERLRGHEASNDRLLLRIVEALRKRHQEADGTAPPGTRKRRAPGRIAADACPASSAEPGSPASAVAAPPEMKSPAGHAPESAESDLGESRAVPAGSPATETAGQDEREEDAPIEEDQSFPAARVLEVSLGRGPEAPPEQVNGSVPSAVPGPEPARREPRPAGDPSGASAGVDNGAGEVPEADDRVPRIPPQESNRPVAPARRLAGAVLALFALIGAAGLSTASARPVVAPIPASPGGPIGRILARWSGHDPTWAVWLCSSRAPDDPAVVLRGSRGSGPVSLSLGSPDPRAGADRGPSPLRQRNPSASL